MSNSHLYAPRFSAGADGQEKITERVNGPASHSPASRVLFFSSYALLSKQKVMTSFPECVKR